MAGLLTVLALIVLGIALSLRIVNKKHIMMQYEVAKNKENRQMTR